MRWLLCINQGRTIAHWKGLASPATAVRNLLLVLLRYIDGIHNLGLLLSDIWVDWTTAYHNPFLGLQMKILRNRSATD
jgi:hypothetical protein